MESEQEIKFRNVYINCIILMAVLLILFYCFRGSSNEAGLKQWILDILSYMNIGIYVNENAHKAIFEIARSIGFTSLLVAWIYTNLGKTEYGFKYGELLRKAYPGYHIVVLIHFGSVILTIWLSLNRYCFYAAYTLGILCLCCFIHWIILSCLIYNPENRRKIAVSMWYGSILRNERQDVSKYMNTIQSISNQIVALKGASTEEIYRCFLQAMDKLICAMKAVYEGQCEKQYKSILLTIKNIWDKLFNNVDDNSGNIIESAERQIIISNIFALSIMNPKKDDDENLGLLYLGYFLWVYGYYSRRIKNDSPISKEVMYSVHKEIEFIILQCNMAKISANGYVRNSAVGAEDDENLNLLSCYFRGSVSFFYLMKFLEKDILLEPEVINALDMKGNGAKIKTYFRNHPKKTLFFVLPEMLSEGYTDKEILVTAYYMVFEDY